MAIKPRFDIAAFPDQALFSRILAYHWLRYEMGCYMVTFERHPFAYHLRPDVLGMNKRRLLIEVEVKISLSDMKADLEKRHRQAATMVSEFRRQTPAVPSYLYYMVSPHLVGDALEVLPPHVGVISRHPTSLSGHTGFPAIVLHRKAVKLHDKRLSPRAVADMVRDLAGTMASLLTDMAYILRGHPELIHNGHLDYDEQRVHARENLPVPGKMSTKEVRLDTGSRTGKPMTKSEVASVWKERQKRLGN